jgi:hypothetical protein
LFSTLEILDGRATHNFNGTLSIASGYQDRGDRFLWPTRSGNYVRPGQFGDEAAIRIDGRGGTINSPAHRVIVCVAAFCMNIEVNHIAGARSCRSWVDRQAC